MFTYTNRQMITNAVIVGCGGTGSRLLPMLSQLMSRGKWNDMVPTITLIDGDEVEVKNLARQNFIADDVGRNKAECLAERYGGAFEIPTVSINQFYPNNSQSMTRWLTSNVPDAMKRLVADRPAVFFLCVDNMKARFNIIQSILYSTIQSGVEHFIVDAGNENTFGQARIFSSRIILEKEFENLNLSDLDRLVPKGSDGIPVPFLPCPIGQYLRASGYQGNPDASCADLEQTAAVNAIMAMSMFSIMQNIYMGLPLKVETWFYDIHNGNDQTRLNPDWVREVMNGKQYRVPADEKTDAYPVSIRELRTIQSCTSNPFWPEIQRSIKAMLKEGKLERVSPEMAEILGL
jgi:Dinucleotide-utilizing enzymes involved in molybdopterin and thiamine biosynthesis family 2